MAADLSVRRIFIASPGGLGEERESLRMAISLFNEQHAFDVGVVFVPCGWEPITGTVMRPQEAINGPLLECDYMVLLFWDKWGSPTGAKGFTSGTEEEFFVAAGALADPSSPMRDVLVLFKGVSEGQMRDPGPQLGSVLRFRDALERTDQVLYNTFESIPDLAFRFQTALSQWAKPLVAPKPMRHIHLDVTDGLPQPDADMSHEQLAERAEELAGQGLVAQAEAAFARAVECGDAEIKLRYARFLRRTGGLDRAFAVNSSVVRDLAHLSDPESAAIRSTALANMGVIKRKQGELESSDHLLEEAVATVRATLPLGRSEFCYALDNLGFTYRRAGASGEALECFRESLEHRVQMGNSRGIAQSQINLSRSLQAAGRLDEAIAEATAAEELLAGVGNDAMLANCLALFAELSLLAGDPNKADSCVGRALEINRALKNSDGIGVCFYLLAEVRLAQGSIDDASEFAQRSSDQSANSSNREGQALSVLVRGKVELARGEVVATKELFEEALQLFKNSGQRDRAKSTEALLSSL